jgi:hypothetical protein
LLGDRVWKGRLFRWWQKPGSESERIEIDFAPKLRIIRDNGWVSLELLLANRSKVTVWVEEARVVLSELDANWQTSIATGQAKHEIRQHVPPDDGLAMSLASAIYNAAGRPQGPYSCLVFTDVLCRVGDEWFSKALDTCRVEMAALTVIRLRRSRWYGKKARPSSHPV